MKPRFKVIGQATNTGYAVLRDGHKIKWFATSAEAKAMANRLNAMYDCRSGILNPDCTDAVCGCDDQEDYLVAFPYEDY